MLSKFIVRSILAVGLVFFMVTTAWAAISGTSTSQPKCTTARRAAGLCSVEVDGILKGLGNVTNNPTAFAVSLFVQEGKIFCYNPGSKTLQGNGVPFGSLAIQLAGADTIEAAQVSKNGKALSDVVFHDPQMIAGILEAKPDLEDDIQCQNANWLQIILVKKAQVFGEQQVDPASTEPNDCNINDPNTFPACQREDALATQCFSPIASEPEQQDELDKALVLQFFSYDCATLCHNKDATFIDCPATPQVL